MTAFIDGKLAPGEVATVATHLRGCLDCRTIVTETARLEREEQRVARRRPMPWWLLAAAAVLVVIIAIPLIRYERRSPIEQLIALAPRGHREIEARLSGFSSAPQQVPSRGTALPDPDEMKFIGAAGHVLEKTVAARTSEA